MHCFIADNVFSSCFAACLGLVDLDAANDGFDYANQFRSNAEIAEKQKSKLIGQRNAGGSSRGRGQTWGARQGRGRSRWKGRGGWSRKQTAGKRSSTPKPKARKSKRK
eukprot:m.263999 g.263999  ORF g.263999 m.263999 type:complete len:108 (-) comp15609_c1_seq1:2250-2573(-)